MAQHDYILNNQSGLAFRQDLNNALAAIVSVNSGAAEPSTTYAYQLWADTTTGWLKQRNAANSAWLLLRTLDSTGFWSLPAGTTAQRPASPQAGMIRFNSSISEFEGYNGTAWSQIAAGAVGGGPDTVFFENDQAITTSYTISTGKNAMTAGPITINTGVTVTVPSGQTWVIV